MGDFVKPKDLQLSVTTVLLWSLPLAIADIGYIHQHGFDAASIGFTALAFLPAWIFVERNVDLKLLGSQFKVTTADVEKAAEKLVEAAPRTLRKAESNLSHVQAGEAKRFAALPDGLRAKGFYSDRLETLRPIIKTRENARLASLDSYANRVLVRFRFEIEQRLYKIAELLDFSDLSLLDILFHLRKLEILDHEFAIGLERFITFGDRAAHGAKVEVSLSPQALESQRIALETLDKVIADLVEIEAPPEMKERPMGFRAASEDKSS